MARSLTETLTDAARQAVEASEWERDQDAWNLPRARGETNAPRADVDEHDAREGEPDEPGDPPATSPGSTE
jgi:hypothetical protein